MKRRWGRLKDDAVMHDGIEQEKALLKIIVDMKYACALTSLWSF